MIRLAHINFGKNKLLGDNAKPNGIETTQFLMQLDRQISEASAEKYLSGNFRVLDTTQMADNANLIFARNDLWQAFKFSAQGNALATHYERCNMMGIPGPPLPPGMPFVSREEFNHGRDMATRAMEQDK